MLLSVTNVHTPAHCKSGAMTAYVTVSRNSKVTPGTVSLGQMHEGTTADILFIHTGFDPLFQTEVLNPSPFLTPATASQQVNYITCCFYVVFLLVFTPNK